MLLVALGDNMSKTREKNSTEHYKAIISKQRKMIKELKKQAGRGDKVKDRYEDLELELAEKLLEEDAAESNLAPTDGCPSCFKGKIERIDIGPRVLSICDTCKYRSTGIKK